MSLPVTDHFSVNEFASRDGANYPVEWLQTRLIPLCRMLEIIREACGNKSIHITSGYRSPKHNADVGGAQKSQHMEGRAADIQVIGFAPSRVHEIILELYHTGKLPNLGGLGVYPAWCHVDTRPRINNHLAQWTGAGIGSEVA